jgi:glycine/D-amino acid oxidase-like deaminating enzyme
MSTPDISSQTSNGKRIVVIGAGIVGAAAALVLQRQGGFSVTLVDKGPPGMECSYGNGGAISPDFCVPASLPGMLRRVPRWFADPLGPLVVRWRRLPAATPWLVRWIRAGNADRVNAASVALRALHATSLTRYDELLGSHAAGLIEKTGQIYVWQSDRASPTEALARALREKQGVVTQVLDAAQIRALDPDLAPGFSRGLFFPDNGHTVNPLRLVQTLVALFVEAGGRLERRNVTGFERADDAVKSVRCEEGGSLAADAVVIAAGIRSGKFAGMLGDAVPLEAERGYHVMLPDPRVRPKIKISNRDQMFGLTPMENGVRISGTVEFAHPDAPMDARRAEILLLHAKRMYPGLNGEGAQYWMGSRPSTPDSLPVVDRASRARNVIYAFGHGHTGLTGAPMTADLVAAMLTGGKPPIDPSPYRVGRF